MRPCLKCGEPSEATLCPDHKPKAFNRRGPAGSFRARGYDKAWDRLSREARRLQPFCSDCGATAGLEADHLPSAWERKAEGKSIRLSDVDVVCGPCNRSRGCSRPGSARADRQGGSPQTTERGRAGKAGSRSHSLSGRGLQA